MAKKNNEPKFDVAKHRLVPKHSKLSENEKKTLLNKYNITIKELPKILSKDPAVARLDVKQGDVIKIERKSFTSNKSVFYRGVINA